MANIPSGNHNDWPWPFSLIPRNKTAVAGPPPPKIIYSANFDHVHYHADVPNIGAWAVSEHPEYGVSFATVQKIYGGNWLLAIGSFRYDYNDGYYTFPRFTIKEVK